MIRITTPRSSNRHIGCLDANLWIAGHGAVGGVKADEGQANEAFKLRIGIAGGEFRNSKLEVNRSEPENP